MMHNQHAELLHTLVTEYGLRRNSDFFQQDLEGLRLFLEKNRFFIEREFSREKAPFYTPLTYAIRKNCPPLVELLINLGADVNKKAENFSPLHYAILNADMSIIKLLVEAGADVNCIAQHHPNINSSGNYKLLTKRTKRDQFLIFPLSSYSRIYQIYEPTPKTPLILTLELMCCQWHFEYNNSPPRCSSYADDVSAMLDVFYENGNHVNLDAITQRGNEIFMYLLRHGADINLNRINAVSLFLKKKFPSTFASSSLAEYATSTQPTPLDVLDHICQYTQTGRDTYFESLRKRIDDYLNLNNLFSVFLQDENNITPAEMTRLKNNREKILNYIDELDENRRKVMLERALDANTPIGQVFIDNATVFGSQTLFNSTGMWFLKIKDRLAMVNNKNEFTI